MSASESYNPNEIVIWVIAPEQLTSEFRYVPKEYALYKFLSWEDDTTIRLENVTYSNGDHCPSGQLMTIVEVLRLKTGKWQLSVESPPDVKCE